MQYFSNDRFDVNRLAAANVAKTSIAPSEPKEAKQLYNIYEGKNGARQLSESVPEFLARLPPSTTREEDLHDWIWIANPYLQRDQTKQDIEGFKATAIEVLEKLEAAKADISESQKRATQASQEKLLAKHRREAETKLLEAAKAYEVTTGKWMFFPLPEDVDSVWGAVAGGTAEGKLGCGAKVAPDEGKGDRVGRLVCVYTQDFSDRDDVKRVLLQLVDMGLVQRRGGMVIYYKCGKPYMAVDPLYQGALNFTDAFTHVGIERGNKWDIKASMYASNDMLKEKR